jgi:hypothetical protein
MRVKGYNLPIMYSFLAKTALNCRVNLKKEGSHSNSIAVTLVVTVRTYTNTNQQEIIKCLDSNVEDHAGRGV